MANNWNAFPAVENDPWASFPVANATQGQALQRGLGEFLVGGQPALQ